MNNVYSRFENLCSRHQLEDFKKIRQLTRPNFSLAQPADIYGVYDNVFTFAQKIIEESNAEKERRLIEVLNFMDGTSITREHALSIRLNFKPIIQFIKDKTYSYTIDFIERQNDWQIRNLAEFVELLDYECVGYSVRREFFFYVMQLETGFALTLNHEQHVVGCMCGSLLNSPENHKINFQIHFVEQKPNLPNISLKETLSLYEKAIIDKFHPDFISTLISDRSPQKEHFFESLDYKKYDEGNGLMFIKDLKQKKAGGDEMSSFNHLLIIICLIEIFVENIFAKFLIDNS